MDESSFLLFLFSRCATSTLPMCHFHTPDVPLPQSRCATFTPLDVPLPHPRCATSTPSMCHFHTLKAPLCAANRLTSASSPCFLSLQPMLSQPPIHVVLASNAPRFQSPTLEIFRENEKTGQQVTQSLKKPMYRRGLRSDLFAEQVTNRSLNKVTEKRIRGWCKSG